jgi:RNA polymerase sigma-70 factor (ECF subfamily)
LWERLRAGDPRATEAWVREQAPRLLSVARRILRSEEDAQDAVQDAFLAAFRALGEFGGGAALSTWLHRIAVNSALMRLRSRQRRREGAIAELLPRFDVEGRHADPVPLWQRPPDEQLGSERTRALVRRCIDRLPDAYRTVLVLRDIEGLGTSEAAAALELTTDALKMRLHRARQALRALLEAELHLQRVRPLGAEPHGPA